MTVTETFAGRLSQTWHLWRRFPGGIQSALRVTLTDPTFSVRVGGCLPPGGCTPCSVAAQRKQAATRRSAGAERSADIERSAGKARAAEDGWAEAALSLIAIWMTATMQLPMTNTAKSRKSQEASWALKRAAIMKTAKRMTRTALKQLRQPLLRVDLVTEAQHFLVACGTTR